MNDLPTLYRRGDAWLYSDRIEDLVDEGVLVPVEPIPIAECWDRRNCCIHSEPEWEVTDDEVVGKKLSDDLIKMNVSWPESNSS